MTIHRRPALLPLLLLSCVLTTTAGQQSAAGEDLKDFYYYGPHPSVPEVPYVGEALTVTRAGLLPDPQYVETLWTIDDTTRGDTGHQLLLTPELLGSRISCEQSYRHPGYRPVTLPCAFNAGNAGLPWVIVQARPGGPTTPTPTTPTLPAPTTGSGWTATTTAGLRGRAEVGARLRAVLPQLTASASTYSYQWLRNGKPIKRATAASYRIRKADRGRRLAVRITASAPGRPDLVSVSPVRRVRR
ncbi:hypothetical protein [Nocardioides nitrophenolicus]|uniref:hypothetical protein n=1 Tax=Nocardioides nitrophenolicus TaxID=60489 RepID=UPI001957D05A|nr:hypothetical protein [Nocardioides nitrophenolicus]MBM7518383.1 hypothetical protein [Nocardioides nitrophenolicus]